MNKNTLINTLKLEPHPNEGGYFRRTYESPLSVSVDAGDRKLLTSIYYMLTNDHPTGYLHKNESDIIHYYHLGSPTQYLMIYPDGSLRECILGPNLDDGQVLQLTVTGNCWKGSKIMGGEFSLISEAVAPGFDYADNTLASSKTLVGLPECTLNAAAPYLKANV